MIKLRKDYVILHEIEMNTKKIFYLWPHSKVHELLVATNNQKQLVDDEMALIEHVRMLKNYPM